MGECDGESSLNEPERGRESHEGWILREREVEKKVEEDVLEDAMMILQGREGEGDGDGWRDERRGKVDCISLVTKESNSTS